MKKLIEILYAAGFEWPQGDWACVAQGGDDGEVYAFGNTPTLEGRIWGGRSERKVHSSPELASDWSTAVITREQYAEYCEQRADGWIPWSGGGRPVPDDTCVDVKFRGGDTWPGAAADEYGWRHFENSGDIVAYRLHVESVSESPVPADAEPTTRRTVYHGGEVYRDCEILLQTAQLTAWRCDGQEYAVRAHQAMIDPDDDQVAAALMSGITGHDIAPEHITELRAQMGWTCEIRGEVCEAHVQDVDD